MKTIYWVLIFLGLLAVIGFLGYLLLQILKAFEYGLIG